LKKRPREKPRLPVGKTGERSMKGTSLSGIRKEHARREEKKDILQKVIRRPIVPLVKEELKQGKSLLGGGGNLENPLGQKVFRWCNARESGGGFLVIIRKIGFFFGKRYCSSKKKKNDK